MEPLRWDSLADDPVLTDVARSIEADLPPFLAELTEAPRRVLDAEAAATQWVVHEGDLPVAVVRGVSLRWDGQRAGAPAGGLAEALQRRGELDADTLTVVDVVVAFGARGRGVGRAVLGELDRVRHDGGWQRLLVLVRPHAKQDYPLVPFARYLGFVDDAGAPFDPWVRVAWHAGLVPVRGVDRSLVVHASAADWQRWLGRPIPGSGPYLVDGAIKPAIIEVERDEGRYREPHLWMAGRSSLHRASQDGWGDALQAADVVAGDRSHREIRRDSRTQRLR